MEVDEYTKKREREFHDSREYADGGAPEDNEDTPAPTELAAEQPQKQRSTLEDLMSNFHENRSAGRQGRHYVNQKRKRG